MAVQNMPVRCLVLWMYVVPSINIFPKGFILVFALIMSPSISGNISTFVLLSLNSTHLIKTASELKPFFTMLH